MNLFQSSGQHELTTITVRRRIIQRATSTKYLQPLHNWLRPRTIRHPHHHPNLPIQLRPPHRTSHLRSRPRRRLRTLPPQQRRLPPATHPTNLHLRHQLPRPPLPRRHPREPRHVLGPPARFQRRILLLHRIHPRNQRKAPHGALLNRVQSHHDNHHDRRFRSLLCN